MRVKDLMEPIKSWLTPEMLLPEAIRVMKSTKRGHGLSVNGLVVLDATMNLVGILSTKDILRILLPSRVHFDSDYVSWEAIRDEKTFSIETTRVSQIMTEDVRVISAEETLLRTADILVTERIRRLPVIRSDGKVVGIIYLRDVYYAMTELLLR